MAKLFLNPSSTSWGSEHTIGDVFEIQVLISDVKDCYGVQFGIEWDYSVLELAGDPIKGDFLEEAGVSTWWFPHSEAGYILCGYMRFEASSGVDVSATENGLVATLKFKALKENSSSKISFVEVDCTWFDSSFNTYTFTSLESAIFTFGVVTYPKITITNLTVPQTASANESFDVVVDWRNDGEGGIAWTRLLDLDANAELTPRTEFQVSKGQTGTIKNTVVMPNKNLRLRLEVGHVE